MCVCVSVEREEEKEGGREGGREKGERERQRDRDRERDLSNEEISSFPTVRVSTLKKTNNHTSTQCCI